jgi:hypothetical protein
LIKLGRISMGTKQYMWAIVTNKCLNIECIFDFSQVLLVVKLNRSDSIEEQSHGQ